MYPWILSIFVVLKSLLTSSFINVFCGLACNLLTFFLLTLANVIFDMLLICYDIFTIIILTNKLAVFLKISIAPRTDVNISHLINWQLASEHSERDTLKGVTSCYICVYINEIKRAYPKLR